MVPSFTTKLSTSVLTLLYGRHFGGRYPDGKHGILWTNGPPGKTIPSSRGRPTQPKFPLPGPPVDINVFTNRDNSRGRKHWEWRSVGN